jgi:hypothetical protein
MPDWPPIAEPELLRRLALGDAEFAEFVADVFARLPARECDAAAIALALAYPWARPRGSYLLRGGEVEELEDLGDADRERLIARFAGPGSDRLPALSIGSNAAPEALERKFAHFAPGEDREVLAVTGRLHDFDVGAAAQPALYGSLPATLFPSPGTAVATTLLWLTPAQFTQLAWSEISYRLGRLRARFEVDGSAAGFDEVLVFVSRFGAFSPQGEPVALAAVPATGRAAAAMSQERLLDDAAQLALGPTATAATLIAAIFEEPKLLLPKLVATVNRATVPFESERWAPLGDGDVPD